MESDEPRRANLLKDKALPKDTKSRIDNVDPSLAMPNTEKADPSRTNVRRDIDEPKLTKSSTDIEDPSRASP
jgi:hypothetical protein